MYFIFFSKFSHDGSKGASSKGVFAEEKASQTISSGRSYFPDSFTEILWSMIVHHTGR